MECTVPVGGHATDTVAYCARHTVLKMKGSVKIRIGFADSLGSHIIHPKRRINLEIAPIDLLSTSSVKALNFL